MKRKLIGLILIIISFLVICNIYEAKATNVELEIENETSDTSTVNEIDSNTITNEQEESATTNTTTTDSDEEDEIEWTDFSNAKFELEYKGFGNANLEISNFTPRGDGSYYIYISNNNNKPEIDEIKEGYVYWEIGSTETIIVRGEKLDKYIELNQNLYVSILEYANSYQEKIVLYGKKLERYEESKYSDAFLATHAVDDSTQILTNFTHSDLHERKIQIKIGKITDTSILRKIKNEDSSGFTDLLTYAKSSDAIYNKTHNSNGGDLIGYDSSSNPIQLTGVEDSKYYFLYVKADDENGKYISPEAVTLALATTTNYGWYLFFYGDADFKWVDFGDVIQDNPDDGKEDPSEDKTIASGTLPQTGLKTLIWIVLGVILVGGGTFSYIQYRKNNF